MKILNSGIEVYDYNPSPQKTMIRLLCIQVQFEIYSNFHSSLGSRGRQSEKRRGRGRGRGRERETDQLKFCDNKTKTKTKSR